MESNKPLDTTLNLAGGPSQVPTDLSDVVGRLPLPGITYLICKGKELNVLHPVDIGVFEPLLLLLGADGIA